MKSMNNRVQLIGRLGTDPELKTFGNDSKMARINVATSERIKTKTETTQTALNGTM